MPDKQHERIGRLVYEAGERANWKDVDSILDWVKALDRGLPDEDEFSALLFWLGRCRVVHKLDQTKTPLMRDASIKVPDLLAVFETENGPLPVLIEVKVSSDRTLSWTPEYFAAMRAYAALVRMPLLVAWKTEICWVLVDTRAFTQKVKNMNLSLETAMKESLLGRLAGDFAFRFHEGAALNLLMRRLGKTETGERVRIEAVFFTDAQGKRCSGDMTGVHLLFMCVDDVSEVEESDEFLHQRFTIRTQNIEQAHRTLTRILDVFSGRRPSPRWREILTGGNLPLWEVGGPRRAAQCAFDLGLLEGFTIEPATPPGFLSIHEREQ